MEAEDGDPPLKRPRLEPPTDPGTPFDDMDDIYGTPANTNTPTKPSIAVNTTEGANDAARSPVPEVQNATRIRPAPVDLGAIPGLGMLSNDIGILYDSETSVKVIDDGARTRSTPDKESGGVHVETGRVEKETQKPGPDPNHQNLVIDEGEGSTRSKQAIESTKSQPVPIDHPEKSSVEPIGEVNHTGLNDKTSKAESDPAFLQAAEENKSNENAEWQIDSSGGASSSSDSTSSDSDSSDDSDEDEAEEDDYKLLGPEEQARILMQGEGGSDDDGGERRNGKSAAGGQLRTKNEVTENIIEKPNVSVTPDMKVEELGAVQSMVENLLVIKANVSGEYQVLESGSVLCLEDRSVIGVVAETLGRVQQPYYSVHFNTREEMSEAGISTGTNIYYVDNYSKYVLTRPLQALKGSDASNLHDEEVGDEEMEFSDDEAEAEHKRRVKLERQAKRDTKPGARGAKMGGPSRPTEPQGLNYDDAPGQDTGDDDLYTPLARPSNLHELMSTGQPPLNERSFQGNASRGQHRGRGKDRGRGAQRGGDRGRGRGRFRGHGQNGDERRNDNQPNPLDQERIVETSGYAGHSYQPEQPSMQVLPPNYAPQHPPHHHQAPQPQYPIQQTHPQAPYAWPPQSPGAGFPFLAQQTQPSFVPPPPVASPGGTFPPGAFVNPAFYRGPQMPAAPSQQWSPPLQHQHQHQQPAFSQQSPTASGGRMSPEADAAFRAAQEKLEILRGLNRTGSGSP
ncbi:MAG: hypothetical protein M1837_002210 [Sclerophora amabilis]|nr:MAG: hypothetical protein M1837_002210 [Sclerophora amabilis]